MDELENMVAVGDRLGKKLAFVRFYNVTDLKAYISPPYITKTEISKIIGMSATTTWRNIEAMRGKYLRRIGPDKGGFWEVLF